MIRYLLPLLALAAPMQTTPLQAVPAMTGDAERFNACVAVATRDPARGIATAQAWRIEGGGIFARHCLAIAQFQASDYTAALASFEAAARSATGSATQSATGSADQSPEARAQARMLWTAMANAALIAGQPARVPAAVDAALALSPPPPEAAQLSLLAAEALVDMKRDADAMAAITKALALDPDVPDGWLLKATLARRMNNLPLAEAAILEAGNRDSDSPEIRYEAGNIAAARGNLPLARAAWTAAVSIDPESLAGKSARSALDANPAEPK
jgi:tetratricopeptide (TPR) repeat protein